MAMTKSKDPLDSTDAQVTLPPWKTDPHLYRDREHLAEVIVDASETSGYYDGVPLSSPEQLQERKQRILERLRRRFPDD